MNTATRTAGFGPEVKRRIMLGTYALSAGYYDAYYGQAQRVRTLVIDAFARAYERVDVLLGATAPSTAFPLGERRRRPDGDVPLGRLHDPVQPRRPPGDQRPVRHRRRRPADRGPGARPALGEERLFRVAAAIEAAAPMTEVRYETVVGLEVHCELRTATKLFCGCPNAFGDEPNTNICPVCLGLPGSLPVLNEQAVELAMRIGTALGCDIRPSIFHRKNYFYPDMPKDYQISQYDEPINVDGTLELPDGTRVGITRAHLEEDTGKTTHVGAGGRIHSADHSLVDYNRAGVPLVEIVSEPDMRSAATGPGLRRPSCGPSSSPPAPPTAGWRRARCGSTPTCRCGRSGPTRSARAARSRT